MHLCTYVMDAHNLHVGWNHSIQQTLAPLIEGSVSRFPLHSSCFVTLSGLRGAYAAAIKQEESQRLAQLHNKYLILLWL